MMNENRCRKTVRTLWVSLALTVSAPAVAQDHGDAEATAVSTIIDQQEWLKRKQFVTLGNGQRVAYIEAGNPAGPPLLLLHGYTDTNRVWSTIIPTLARYRLIIPDQRGHGASEAPPCCYAVSDLAYDAHLLLDELGIETAYVVGHSLGSFVAQEMAAAYSHQIAGIILLASTAQPAIKADSDLYKAVAEMNAPLTVDAEFLDGWLEAGVDPAYGDFARAEAAATPLHVWKGVIHELVGLEVARHARLVTQPVLLVSATDDELFELHHRTALSEAYPHAEPILLENAGHNFPMRMPGRTAAIIDSWLRSQQAD